MSIKTISQSQLGQDTAKNSQVVTTVVKNFTSGITTSSGPVITNIIYTDNSFNNTSANASSNVGGNIKIIGTGFQPGSNLYLSGNLISSNTYVSSTEYRAILPATTIGTYTFNLFSPTNAGTIWPTGIQFQASPVWTTSNVSTSLTSVSGQLAATGAVSYAVTSGSLPGGLSLSSSGLLSGTFTGSNNTPITFTVTATNVYGISTSQTVTYIRNTTRGLTSETAAVSAQQVYDTGGTTSGWYYIQTSTMGSPRLVYCNMTDEGGGWMLISYGSPLAQTGIPYPNVWLNGQGTLSANTSANTMDLWKHNNVAQCTQVLKMASTSSGVPPLLSNMEIANKVVYSNPSNLQLSSGTAHVNNTAMTGTWYPVKGHTLMNSPLTINAPGDWMYTEGANFLWTVCGPSTDLANNGRSGNGQGTGSWTFQNNTAQYGVKDVVAGTSSDRSDINSYAVFIK